eukprot:CFRG7455T1
MKFTMPTLMYLVGLTTYLAVSSTHAASTVGEASSRSARSATHSLTSSEVEHLQRVTQAFVDEGPIFYQYTASNFGTTDEYSVRKGDDNECIVMLAPTDSIAEWISNFNFPVTPVTLNGEVLFTAHNGFVISAEAIDRDGLVDKIESNCGPVDVVTFAGHSRGGGTAQVLSAWYHERNLYKTIKMVTWGSPRSFSSHSANDYHGAYHQVRCVNEKDEITRVPDSILGYKHFGTVVCLDCDDTSQDAEGSFSLNLLHHLMLSYNSKIQSIST